MNMSKQAVESKLGHPKRMTSNEYELSGTHIIIKIMITLL
ncbi:hypothetical protein BN1318_1960007 [Staphylococcus capitis]|nr:hypothetical protein BN1318_1960007 [Staphylococcus capitis]